MTDYNLFLDDKRNPSDVLSYQPHTWNLYYELDWVIVRNYEEFVSVIQSNELPTRISFDHDLSLEHYAPRHLWDDYEAAKEWMESQNYKEKTGKDCADFLINHIIDTYEEPFPLPKMYVHSQNPVGVDNIKSVFKTAMKVYSFMF